MYFNGTRVTLDNIPTVFKDYSLDIQDEVRSMVLDGFDLLKWVDACKENPYRLNQIRLGYREGVDPRFFGISSGVTLYNVRKYLSSGFSGEELIPYIGKGFTEEQWNYLISWAESGYLDKRLNLLRTPLSLWSYIDRGLKLNLPMWVFTTGKSYSSSKMKSMITLLSNGKPIQKFLQGTWRDDVLEILAENSGTVWYDSIVDSVYEFVSPRFLSSVCKLAKKRLIDEDLFVLGGHFEGTDLYYLYSPYHLEAMYWAVSKGYDYTRFKDYNLSSSEVDVLISELERDGSRKFKGRL